MNLRRLAIPVFCSVLCAAAGLALDAGAAPAPAPAPAVAPAPEAAPAPAPEAAPAPAPAPEVPASELPVQKPGPFRIPEDLSPSSRDIPLPTAARFVVIELHTEVSLGMASFVERVIGQLHDGDILVLDINTFGGRVDAAVRIRDALLEARSRHHAWTIAYIHPRAISAGALISYANDIIVVSPGATMGAATPVTIEGGEMKATDEKVVSYMRQEMRATAEARGRDGDLAAAMVDRDLKFPGLSDKGKLLTLDGDQALEWKVASFEALDLHQLIDKLGYGPDSGRTYTIDRMKWSWAETMAGWLSGSMLAGLLMTIGMLGIMIGLYTGGNPVPLAVGGVCLALFFFGHHIVALVGLEEIILFALGAALVAFEMFVPGHIVPGVIGVLLILGSLVMGLVDMHTVPLSIQWEEGWITRALATVFGSILATAVLAYAAFRVLPESRYFRRFLLPGSIDSRATDRVSAGIREVVGEVGIAVTHLRPAGTVKIRGRRYDAVAERGYIDQGKSVTVIRAQGFSVVVTETRAPAAGPEEDA